MKKKLFIQQLMFISCFVVMTVLLQVILFKTDSIGWIDSLFVHPWLWIVYFVVSHVLVERIFRK